MFWRAGKKYKKSDKSKIGEEVELISTSYSIGDIALVFKFLSLK